MITNREKMIAGFAYTSALSGDSLDAMGKKLEAIEKTGIFEHLIEH
jgi:hypothetical protein